MTAQTNALHLANALRDGVSYDEAEIESELRRLHAQRGQLLEALKSLVKSTARICDGSYGEEIDNDFLQARAAIRAVEENT